MQSPTTEIAAADTNEELLLELVEPGLNSEVIGKLCSKIFAQGVTHRVRPPLQIQKDRLPSIPFFYHSDWKKGFRTGGMKSFPVLWEARLPRLLYFHLCQTNRKHHAL